MIDNLNLTYSGNQLQSVNDAATNSVFGNGLEFKDGANQTIEYTYDKNGNLTKDLNKNITSIQYNLLNLPSQVTFGNGNSIEYEYAANGTKLRTLHITAGVTTTTDYCGNAIYENGVLKTLLNEAGYVSLPDKKFHFYLKDHQGNVRLVADKDGNVEETNNYYPFGGTFTTAASVQPYKYNGKELDRKNGLNLYDYGARHYDAAIGRFTTVDPMAEKYYQWSPYVYCKNNPIRFIDPTGNDWRDIVAGYGIGLVTNAFPGTGHLRDFYAPNSSTDYNNALQGIDNATTVAGASMVIVGGLEMAGGSGTMVAGGAATTVTGGVASPIILIGGALELKGAATIATGSMLMFNSDKNREAGYNRGKSKESSDNSYSKSSGKNEKHSNFKARESAREKMDDARTRLETMRKSGDSSRKEMEKVQKEIKHWKNKMDDAGETHHRK